MKTGRRPKPDALKVLQGNSGRRPIVEPGKFEMEAPAIERSDAPSRNAKRVTDLSTRAQEVFELVGPQLRKINFLRETDEHAFLRYCETLARYWTVTERLDALGGETYECETANGGAMMRMHPDFMVQERLAKRLDSLEDRFGLTPAARQQYMLALARAPMRLPGMEEQPAKKPADSASTPPSAPPRPSVIGTQRRDALN